MKLAWDQVRDGMTRGYSAEGLCLAQVARVFGPNGDEVGFLAWLVLEGAELFDHYPTADAAMAAAESALDHHEHISEGAS